MSQLTLIIKREKSQTESKLSFQSGESLLLLCQKAGIELASPCGGKGICGKCKVKFITGAPIPKPSERRWIPAEELRDGYRLACMAVLTSDCEILLPEIRNVNAIGTGIDVFWDDTEIAGGMTDCKNGHRNNCVNDCMDKNNNGDRGCFVTADIGTTTVVMEKRRVRDGKVVGVYRDMNMQKKYGADVLSRMEASVEGKKEELSILIREQIENGLHKLSNEQDILKRGMEDIQFMIVAANTSMIHLLMGYDVKALSRAPFVPQTLDEIETEIGGIKTYIMPGISAFVGADLTAGMYAVRYQKKKTAWKDSIEEKSYVNLLIDLGTNAEMILFDEKKAVCTSAAAGCAFDSIAEAGVYGADVIAILAGLLRKGDIDRHGTLRDELFDTGVTVELEAWNVDTENKETMNEETENISKKPIQTILLKQDQIRQMQLAKAAVRCGIDYLTETFGCRTEDISRVYLAGGFGYYLDTDAAVTVGLLPEICRNITYSCGNTALAGAAVYAKENMDRFIGSNTKIQATENILKYTGINLAKQPDFSERYISYLDFE